jgi:ABC-2 type transport system ATP-binding protein
MLELQRIRRTYGHRVAVHELSVALRGGEVIGLLGPNGAGKTTTIKMIAGLLTPSSGRILLDGVDAVENPTIAKQRLAYIPDRPYVPERLSARELLQLLAGLYDLPSSSVDNEGMAQLRRFGLQGREDDLLSTFSHGMRQRALLAGAFMRQPRVLLVDEPMVGLDPQGMRLVKTILREAATDGAVVIMSTHTLDVVEEVCDRVLVMGQGQLLADNTVPDLLARMPADNGQRVTLEDVFLQLTAHRQDAADGVAP